MMGAVAQYEKIPNRAETPRRTDAEAGERRALRRPEAYGFYEGEAAAVERVKALRAEGLGFDRIAARLNEESIPPARGRGMAWLSIEFYGKEGESRGSQGQRERQRTPRRKG